MRPLIIINLILSVGGIMNIGYEKAYLMQTSLNLPASEIIDTYVYRIGMVEGQYSIGAAVGLFKSVISFALILGANKLAKKTTGSGIF